MRRSKFTREQISIALRHAEASTSVTDLCQGAGDHRDHRRPLEEEVRWAGGRSLGEFKQLREENRKLKQFVANPSLNKTILQDSLGRNGEAGGTAGMDRTELTSRAGSLALPAPSDTRLQPAGQAHGERGDRVVERLAQTRVSIAALVSRSADAQRILGAWYHEYNNHRPHSSLGDQRPVHFRSGGHSTPDQYRLPNVRS